jgi:hypothetical protein
MVGGHHKNLSSRGSASITDLSLVDTNAVQPTGSVRSVRSVPQGVAAAGTTCKTAYEVLATAAASRELMAALPTRLLSHRNRFPVSSLGARNLPDARGAVAKVPARATFAGATAEIVGALLPTVRHVWSLCVCKMFVILFCLCAVRVHFLPFIRCENGNTAAAFSQPGKTSTLIVAQESSGSAKIAAPYLQPCYVTQAGLGRRGGARVRACHRSVAHFRNFSTGHVLGRG